jgi:hypothetical protein
VKEKQIYVIICEVIEEENEFSNLSMCLSPYVATRV